MKRREIPASPEADVSETVPIDPTAILLRLKQLGDQGLQAAMQALEPKEK